MRISLRAGKTEISVALELLSGAMTDSRSSRKLHLVPNPSGSNFDWLTSSLRSRRRRRFRHSGDWMTLAYNELVRRTPATTRNDELQVVHAVCGYDALLAHVEDRTATIAVVGLGYVGLPLLVAAAEQGFATIGYDADTSKI